MNIFVVFAVLGFMFWFMLLGGEREIKKLFGGSGSPSRKSDGIGSPKKDGPSVPFWKVAGVVIVIIASVLLLFDGFVTVGPGERGVLLEFGRVTGVVLGEGLHFKMPIMNSVDVVDVKTQKVQAEASAASKDLQIVTSSIALNYRVNPSDAAKLRQSVGPDYRDKIIDPSIQEAVKSATAQFTAEELITKRASAREVMKANVKEKLNTLSNGAIEVLEFNIENFEFSAEFDSAIESKVTAEQKALKAERDLDRILVEAEQKVAQAQAEADSLRIQSVSLRNNTEVLGLRWIEKWDGTLPMYMGGESPMLFLPMSEPTASSSTYGGSGQ